MRFQSLHLLLPAFVFILAFQNCSDKSFSSAKGDSGVVGPFDLGTNDNDGHGVTTQTGGPNCREEIRSLTIPLKIFFVVDVSGSNVDNNGVIGSDPDKLVRGGSMERFFNTYSGKSNFSWGLITFKGTTASTLLANAASVLVPSALQTFRSINDTGNTPYVAALQRVAAEISGDSSRTNDTNYVVVFLSDGLPNPSVSDATLAARVGDVINTVPGHVSFNSIYYGKSDPTPSERLRKMAEVGGGNFLDTNMNPTGKAFLITDLVNLPGTVCN